MPTVSATGYSGLNQYIHGDLTPYSTTQQFTTQEKKLNRILMRGRGGKRLKAVLYALTGAAVGASKAVTIKQVQATAIPGQSAVGGGLVTIETVSLVTGVTTSADLVEMQSTETKTSKPSTYPADKSGIPSGGRAGQI
jgi:hypothetical protein